MNLFYNKKKKGYTLAEVLATVAILLILMAIAVPAIYSIRKNLRQKALDNKLSCIPYFGKQKDRKKADKMRSFRLGIGSDIGK